MKKKTHKQIIVIGFIAILSTALLLVGFAITDMLEPTNTAAKSTIDKNKVATVEKSSVEKKNKKTKIASTTQKKEPIVEKKETQAPIITAPELTVYQGDEPNIYDQVTASDNVDGEITNKLIAETTLDTSITGTFSVRFSATDKSGNTGTVDRIVHVIPKEIPADAPAAIEPPSTEPLKADTSREQTTAVAKVQNYAPLTLTIKGTAIPYQNGGQETGQSIIDSNPNGVASTWGGATIQSGDDGQNTHFIGHNPGIFSAIFSLSVGNQIIVTDATGTPTTYTVHSLLHLDDFGVEVGTGIDYFDLIVGATGGERITLQSCIDDDTNLVVIANK